MEEKDAIEIPVQPFRRKREFIALNAIKFLSAIVAVTETDVASGSM